MPKLPLKIGQEFSFAKTVSETDVIMFAGISGDFAPVHTNEAYMAGTAFGRRIAHGALLVGYMSTASTKAAEHAPSDTMTAVSLGYDRVRFVAPVFMGDTVTVGYRIAQVDEDRARAVADIEVVNQDGKTVAVAQHQIKWVANS